MRMMMHLISFGLPAPVNPLFALVQKIISQSASQSGQRSVVRGGGIEVHDCPQSSICWKEVSK